MTACNSSSRETKVPFGFAGNCIYTVYTQHTSTHTCMHVKKPNSTLWHVHSSHVSATEFWAAFGLPHPILSVPQQEASTVDLAGWAARKPHHWLGCNQGLWDASVPGLKAARLKEKVGRHTFETSARWARTSCLWRRAARRQAHWLSIRDVAPSVPFAHSQA